MPRTSQRHDRIRVANRLPEHQKKEITVGLDDKIKNATEKVAGKAKEAFGDATDNERLQTEGQADQSKADIKGAGENIKDAFKQ
jgi:uncharacterized protein YjbJ (UPF0337 family)